MALFQKSREQRSNGSEQPIVWVCKSDHKGDFYNGLAVAKALSPDNTRILAAAMGGIHTLRAGEEENTLYVNFVDEATNRTTRQTISRNDLPDVFINSTSHYLHLYVKGLKTHQQYKDIPLLLDTLAVHIVPPDNDIISDRYHPETDMTVGFRHQIKTPDLLQPNMYIYDTVPTRVNAGTLEQGKKAWKDELSVFEKARPVYFVTIGERLDDNKELSLQDAKELAAKVAAAIKKTGGSLVMSTSPRTNQDKEVIAAFTKELEPQTPCYCYDYNASKGQNNPYSGLLALADRIILTSDSMSMASDGIATGKPVYIYDRLSPDPNAPGDEQNRVGHDAYTKNLLDKGLILPIDQLADPVAAAKSHPVNSAEQIANDIRAQLALRQQQQSIDRSSGKSNPLAAGAAKQVDAIRIFLEQTLAKNPVIQQIQNAKPFSRKGNEKQ